MSPIFGEFLENQIIEGIKYYQSMGANIAEESIQVPSNPNQ
jgi:hypothetical protein